jgi:hypothetical protein
MLVGGSKYLVIFMLVDPDMFLSLIRLINILFKSMKGSYDIRCIFMV